jgi:hypothetical protein
MFILFEEAVMAPKRLNAHPPWRQILIVAVVVPVVLTLAVLAFAWPAARLKPRDLPIGVVASPGSQRLVAELSTSEPGAFHVRTFSDDSAARDAIRARTSYGAFELTQHHLVVLVAGAAGPTVAQLLESIAEHVGQSASLPVSPVDVVPLSSSDPRGVVFSSALLPVTICSVLVAAAVAALLRLRSAWRQTVALAIVSTAAATAAYLVAQPFLGALPHNAWASWASLALMVFSISASVAGLVALTGLAGVAVGAAIMILLGNPFSGVTSAPELLPNAAHYLGQAMPPGAGAQLLRSTAYFSGDGATGHVVVLAAWAVAGIAAVVAGHRLRSEPTRAHQLT